MTQLSTQPNMMLSAPRAGQGVTQPGTMGAPIQTQLDPMAASGPGQGGAATVAGVGAVMQSQQGMNALPQQPPEQGGATQDMAMQSGQAVQQPGPQQPSPQGNSAWLPGTPNSFSQSGMLYSQGQGPVSGQVPPMTVAAAYRPFMPRSNAKGAKASSMDLELLATGTSQRFRKRYGKAAVVVEHVQHTIAPVDGKTGETSGSKRAQISKLSGAFENPVAQRPVAARRRNGLLAFGNLIYVNEKFARRIGPNDAYKLNHPTDGPMKLSAVGESGLIMAERDWQINGPAAWPEPRPIGRSLVSRGVSKMAAGPKVEIAKSVLRPVGKWLGRATGWTAGAGANPVATAARRFVTTGLGSAGANEALQRSGVDTGVKSTDVGFAAGTAAFLAGKGAPGLGPVRGRVQNVKSLFTPSWVKGKGLHQGGRTGGFGTTAIGTAKPLGLADRAMTAATARGAGGYSVGAPFDAAARAFVPRVPAGDTPFGSWQATSDPNVRGTFGTAGLFSGVGSVLPGPLGTTGALLPQLVGGAKAFSDIENKLVRPGATEEALAQTAAQTLSSDNQLGTGVDKLIAERFTEAAPNLAERTREAVAKRMGVKPEEVTGMQMVKEADRILGQLETMQSTLGDDPVLGKLLSFAMDLGPWQQLLVGGAIVAAIIGIVSALAGKGGTAAISLLAALGAGGAAYAMGSAPFKGLVGLGQKPGGVEGATEAAEAASMDTPADLDAKARESGRPAGEAPGEAPGGLEGAAEAPGVASVDVYLKSTPHYDLWQQLDPQAKAAVAQLILNSDHTPQAVDQIMQNVTKTPPGFSSPPPPGVDPAQWSTLESAQQRMLAPRYQQFMGEQTGQQQPQPRMMDAFRRR